MIAGLQKMTLLDYPGKVACTIFLQGCNFRCPFCHNSGLLSGSPETPVSEEALFTFLKKRVGLLDGVCITGGEPALYRELPALVRRIRELGFLVKLDTNGSRPQMLEGLAKEGLLDYVAMDIKNAPERYAATTGLPHMDLAPVEQSIRFLLEGLVDWEFRTTVTDELHDPGAMKAIGQWLKSLSPEGKAPRFFLQPYVERESVLQLGMHAPDREKLARMAAALAPYVGSVELRGQD